jgi:methylated-DNA-[protein]-cysteine S-methyltransferase
MKNKSVFFKKSKSSIGNLFLYATEESLLAVLFATNHDWILKQSQANKLVNESNPILEQSALQLEEYFSGQRKSFDLKLDPIGTAFQKKAWRVLSKIPYGKTLSYKEQAKKIGSEKAMRAVGGANGKNPIAIIIPCHRVIGASGKLTGYAGGLDKKARLLKIEGHRL